MGVIQARQGTRGPRPLDQSRRAHGADIEQEGTGADATILEHLGDVYSFLQDLDKAGEAWRQAAKAAAAAVPPDKRLPEIKKKLEALEKMGPMPKPGSHHTP